MFSIRYQFLALAFFFVFGQSDVQAKARKSNVRKRAISESPQKPIDPQKPIEPQNKNSGENNSQEKATDNKTQVGNQNNTVDQENSVIDLSENALRFLKSKGVSPSNVGLLIKKTDGLIVQHRSSELMIPASLSKIVTAATVLSELPHQYAMYTRLLSKAEIKNGVLEGDLYLKGGGDPAFVSENMWFLVNELTRTGITEIKGKIFVDSTRFDQETYSESRQEERVDRAYDAPVGAMSFNWNSVNVFVRPNRKKGEAAQVFLDPVNDYVILDSSARTKGGGGQNIGVSRTQRSGRDVIVISGSIGENANEFVSYKNISKPSLWSGSNLKEFMRQRGIKVGQDVLEGKVPEGAKILAEYKSKPFAHIVADMQKFSNNYVAEMLVKNLAAEKKGEPGNIISGLTVVADYLKKIGIEPGTYTFKNPSGLTRENKLSPQQIVQILESNREQFRTFPEYISALPIAGVDGTLKNRFKDHPESIRAKTGLLTGVVGLAGYGMTDKKEPFTFVFIYNGPENFFRVKEAFDDLALKVVESTL